MDPTPSFRTGCPSGTVTEFEWNQSTAYPGTSRKFWVYVPAQYDAAEPASLMVFQDGEYYLDPLGEVRAAIVLDNLIHRGDLPVTIGVFVNPGIFADAETPTAGEQRNAEYDAFDDRYVTFLLEEIIPEVTRRWSITDDPDRWGICGCSSGGNCAFTAAWLRPDAFRRVIGCLSSFAQMPDGNPYPALISQRPASRCASSCKPATATWAGTSQRTTGSPTTCASPPRWRRPTTTSASSSATADTTRTTVASCCPTPCAGCSGPTEARWARGPMR